MESSDLTDAQIRELLAPLLPLEATIVNTVDSSLDDLYVTIDSFSDGFKYVVNGWEPRIADDASVDYPERGDVAAVVKADSDEYWMVSWRHA